MAASNTCLFPIKLNKYAPKARFRNWYGFWFVFVVAGSKKPTVLSGCHLVHQVTALNPGVVDILHVRIAEDLHGVDIWVAFKVLCSLFLDDGQEGLQLFDRCQ